MTTIWMRSIFAAFVFLSVVSTANAWDRGIYLTQYMAENPAKLDYFLKQAKETGINAFVIDHDYFSSKYAPMVAKVKAAGIKVITRVVVFSDGGNAKQVRSPAAWEDKYRYVYDAIKAGTDTIQLDYIRYSSKLPADPQHAKDVYQVIKWFRNKVASANIPMEIDIFGEVSYYPSMHIGQDIKMFADTVDGVNPMVYPSHFWPYQKYSAEPYKTINNSLNALVAQFDDKAPFKVHAFIEAANYHLIKKTNDAAKQKYLLEEIRAVEDAKGAAGWYVWSANNVYENLFTVLKKNKTKMKDDEKMDTARRTESDKIEPKADVAKTETKEAVETSKNDVKKLETTAKVKTSMSSDKKIDTHKKVKTSKNDTKKINAKDKVTTSMVGDKKVERPKKWYDYIIHPFS